MRARVYYNENDPKAAAWLRELMAEGLITEGEIDERSIREVQSADVRGFTQCHFFAGIGGFAAALRLAEWPDSRPIWTGSAPCQPYSVAGQGKGDADERNLWPDFFRLIRECRPDACIGEQVAAAIRYGWLDGISTDLEGEDYAVGAIVLGAHSVGAPHKRQRLYWMAHTHPLAIAIGGQTHSEPARGLHAESSERGAEGPPSPRGEDASNAGKPSEVGRLGDTVDTATTDARKHDEAITGGDGSGDESRECGSESGVGSFWSNFTVIQMRDGKARRIPRVEPLLQRVAPGLSDSVDPSGPESGFPLCEKIEGRAMLLKGYGNAICLPLAVEFVKAYMDCLHD